MRGTPVTFLKCSGRRREIQICCYDKRFSPASSSNADQIYLAWTWTCSTERLFRFSFLRATKWSKYFISFMKLDTPFTLMPRSLSLRALHEKKNKQQNTVKSEWRFRSILHHGPIRIRPVSNTAEIIQACPNSRPHTVGGRPQRAPIKTLPQETTTQCISLSFQRTRGVTLIVQYNQRCWAFELRVD